MVIKKKRETNKGYVIGVSAEVYKMLEEVKANAEGKLSLRSLANELLKEAIMNIEWVEANGEAEEKDIPLEVLMKERI